MANAARRQTVNTDKLEGVIVGKNPCREADLFLTIIGHPGAKLSIYAQGARSGKKKFHGGLDLFDHGIFETSLAANGTLKLNSFIPLTPFKTLREHMANLAVASLVCESFSALVSEEQLESAHILMMLIEALALVERARGSKDVLRAGFLSLKKLISFSGFGSEESFGEPSANNLERLMNCIENCCERELKTKSEIAFLLHSIRQIPRP